MAQNEAAHATIHAHPGTTRTFIDAVCPHVPASGKGDGESVRQSNGEEVDSPVRFPRQSMFGAPGILIPARTSAGLPPELMTHLPHSSPTCGRLGVRPGCLAACRALIGSTLSLPAEDHVWIDAEDHLVRRFELTEDNGNVRRFDLSDVQINPTLRDDLFRFTPPPGAQVIHRG